MNKRMLTRIALGLASTLSPIFTTIMALRPDSIPTCRLDEVQAVALQSLVATFNASCVYNVTVSRNELVQW